MYCPNCGTSINDGNFCPNCGKKIEIINSQNENDEELVRAYIGPKYEEFVKNDFSVCTLLFGIFYLFYRKMWIMALIWWGVDYLLGLILNSAIYYNIITIGITIYLACIFKKQYLEHVHKKVQEIKSNYHGNDHQQLIDLCRKKGGTTIWPVIIVIIFFVLLVLLIIYMFGFISNEKNIDRTNNYDLPKLKIDGPKLEVNKFQVKDYILNI